MSSPTFVASMLVVAVALLLALSLKLRWPSSLVLLAGGVAAGLVPGLPDGSAIDPKLVLGLVLPVLLYASVVETSTVLVREQAVRGIALGLPLQLCLAGAAALAARLLLDLGWPGALMFGVVLAVGDTSLAAQMGWLKAVPKSARDLLSAQGLVSALVLLMLFQLVSRTPEHLPAPAALLGATAKSWGLGLIGGLVLGWGAVVLRRRIASAQVEVALSLATPLAASALAEASGASVVLVVIVAALAVKKASVSPESGRTLSEPFARITSRRFWMEVRALLSGALAFLVGYAAVDAIASGRPVNPVAIGAATFLALGAAFILQAAFSALALGSMRLGTASAVVTARAPLGLLIALAVPERLASGAPFAERDAIVVATAAALLLSVISRMPFAARALRPLRPTAKREAAYERGLVEAAVAGVNDGQARTRLLRDRAAGAIGDESLEDGLDLLDRHAEATRGLDRKDDE